MTSTTPTTPTTATLDVDHLRISGVPSDAVIVDEVRLEIAPGEIVGVVGESGSGKTTLGLGLLAYCKRGTRLDDGRILIGGRDIAVLPAGEVRRMRGVSVAYIPQSPASALNPALRIGTQLRECVGDVDEARVREVLREVALPDDDTFLKRYPHQLSGGQQQRIAIAMAFIGKPRLIVLDEPTTGLDVTTQKHVLETVRRMCSIYGSAAVYISHDMAVVADLVDRIAVMYSGRVVEAGPAAEVLARPRHPYTARLLMAVPDLAGERQMLGIPGHAPSPLHRPDGCAFAPRCLLAEDRCTHERPPERQIAEGHTARCFKAGEVRVEPSPRVEPAVAPTPEPVLEISGLSARYGRKRVLEGVDLTVARGHCTALLGESGSGKTTLSRCIAGLHADFEGTITLDGEPLPASSFRRTTDQRRRVQYVFQNPYESLNPRKTVRELVLAPVKHLCGAVADPEALLQDVLAQAALRPDLADRFPDQLSGGERQRVAIARALAAKPDVLVCDEVTSALDVSVQSSIVELLQRLQAELDLTLVFVTHDIALVRNIAQQVAVLEHGRIVEHGPVREVMQNPQHAYTRSLMKDTPTFVLEGTP
ncbi:ABC transporter ATP-binding protein [Pseudonocardia sp. TRM90224]|uniref:ABC transporter ATP-binding protein n=1 Tax=Pseudonocardia sp. TRM90224 TaxID=2812678 RepID=UPI001E392ABB|nr:ABC transporter ATP-binding protein [Pseudonocardia sp. TRM90224]